MKLTIDPIEIQYGDEPFWGDKLERKEFGEGLRNLITKVDDKLVISLDAPWGEGKTTFVKMWRNCLKEENIKSIYFDAFAKDYFEDPFVAIVSHIKSLIDDEFEEDSSIIDKLNDFLNKSIKAAGKISKYGLNSLSSFGSLYLQSEGLDVPGEVVSSVSDFASGLIKAKIDSYFDDEQDIEEFIKSLTVLAQEIREKTDKPLVFIIDELDRCKPTYALSLIEKIKHLFSVENIVFVLVMHKSQLEESVRCVYGQKIEAKKYLQKFINLECDLPKDPDIEVGDYNKYVNDLYIKHDIESFGDEATHEK